MKRLTVATLNLHGRQHRWSQRRHLVVTELVKSAPDLVSLQEIARLGGAGRWLQQQINYRLAAAGERPYRLVQERRQHWLHGTFESTGILSRLPLISHDSFALGPGDRAAVRANIALPSGLTLDFVATHFRPGAHERQAREEQALALIGWLGETGHAPFQIIAGDFNETPDGPAIRRMKQVFRSAYEAVYDREPLATFPTALVVSEDGWSGCLDYIFVSSAVRVREADLFCRRHGPDDDTLYPSDHVGVLAGLDVSKR
ncbi:MAG: endonuclease/exonuclease/phosphatase family protein [Candidatus Promineifilaceae bacterium]|nr:endonuclease/exonuclease/phosphatase family protein [Candidatus Promineifilaceae bacterium]